MTINPIDPTVWIPLLLIFTGAGLAALMGHPSLNQRVRTTQMGWLLALFPLVAFGLLLLRIPAVNEGVVFTWRWEWLPSMGVGLGFYVDSLALFFALIVTFIGVLVVVYAGQYFKGDQGAWRFLTYLLLFMGSMLGLVMAGDVLTLFIFWEGTSMLSYLLVAYKYKYEEARKGAFRALFITAGGGIAMLAGLLFVSYVAGGTDFQTILSSGDVLRENEFYLVMLVLVSFGAFTKSAQVPAHIWLPGAMSAPTPASAYLHSATMVKAGIYLMARMNPALGFTEPWFWLLTIAGGMTMITGAYLGLKQNDLKGLLAYSTISQLGILMMLIGQDIPEAYKALVIGVLAHALYKSALFLTAGIVDHETGTRDLRRLGGLAKVMPFTFAAALLAALSMAGLPPMFGFLAKETLLATAVHPSLPPVIAELIRWGTVVAGALMLAQAGLLIWETFLGKPKDDSIHGHEAPWAMWLAPLIPAALSIIFSILPGPKEEATFLAGAAAAAYGDKVKVNFILFHGLTVEFALSLVAITLGTILFLSRHRVRAWQDRVLPGLSFNRLYEWVLRSIDRGAYAATRLQQGRLRVYLMMMVATTAVLVLYWGWGNLWPGLSGLSMPTLDRTGEIDFLYLFSLFVVVGASLAAVVLRRDFSAILALGASGLAVAIIFALEPAPDVALVQIVVDILSLVILVLALGRLPRRQRRAAQEISTVGRERLSRNLWWDIGVSLGIGLVVTLVTFLVLMERPFNESLVTPFYEMAAKPQTGATDIVGAIVVDFRALDTVIEIAVFSVAGLGIYTLLRYAARKFGDRAEPADLEPRRKLPTRGIGSLPTSAFIRVPSYVTLPIAMVLGATHMMYGHDQPGDGFTAGVIISLAIGLWYVVFGWEETSRRLPWLRPRILIESGILLAISVGMVAFFVDGSFLGNVDFGEMVGLPLPKGFHISTSFLLEVAICLTVLGSVAYMLRVLGYPEYRDIDSTQRLDELSAEETRGG